MLGAADSEQLAMIGVLMLSSLLSVAYLLPIVARGFFLPAAADHPAAAGDRGDGNADNSHKIQQLQEAPLFCVLPLCITALGCILLFFFADPIYQLLSTITANSR